MAGTKTVRPAVGGLPMTGANISTLAAIGAGLIGTGVAMTVKRDREAVAAEGLADDEDTPID